MSILKIFKRDERGTGAIEFAVAFPVLITMIIGIFTIGQMFEANAGMQHALGEGARFANLFPIPTNAQIKAKIQAKVYGVKSGQFTVADPQDLTDATSAQRYKLLSVTYTMPMDFGMWNGNPVSVTRTKRVYTSS